MQAQGQTSQSYPVRPDLVAARRWLWTLRRVDLVEIAGSVGAPHCRVSGTGRRQPVSPRIGLATALGLGVLGVPLVVEVVSS